MKKFLTIFCTLITIHFCTAQNIGIGTTNPNSNAALDITSSSKGLLVPRMDSTSRKNIPATNGLMVYDTTTKSFWYNDGTRWVNMPPKGNSAGDLLYWNGAAWTVLPAGNSGQYLGATASGVPAWSTVNTGGTGGNIATQNVSNIAPTTVQSGGSITSDAGAAITARGVVWSTSPNPTISLTTKTNDGTGIGNFVSNLTNLTPATTYYVRAYYTNANGTSYGNQVTFATVSNFTIGQSYGGGKIFYIDNTGQHGLIVSLTDQSTGITWDNQTIGSMQTFADEVVIGSGANNTNAIILYYDLSSYAATLCRYYYSGGGFTDWFLPSLYELNQLNLVNTSLGLADLQGIYWSSSEIDSDEAWTVFISPEQTPNQYQYYKSSNSTKVRAIRKF